MVRFTDTLYSKVNCSFKYEQEQKTYFKKRKQQTVENYSVLKRNEPSSHERTWWNLTYILLSERSLYEKASVCFQWSDILEKAKL